MWDDLSNDDVETPTDWTQHRGSFVVAKSKIGVFRKAYAVCENAHDLRFKLCLLFVSVQV